MIKILKQEIAQTIFDCPAHLIKKCVQSKLYQANLFYVRNKIKICKNV